MKKKSSNRTKTVMGIVCTLIILILVLSLSSANIINYLTKILSPVSYSTFESENLSFDGIQNYSRWIEIYKFANVTYAAVNFTGNYTNSPSDLSFIIANTSTFWTLKGAKLQGTNAIFQELNDSSTSKTLTFQDNSTDLNQTVFVNLFKLSLVNDFKLNLSSSTVNTIDNCYQETANISTSCGGLSTGRYALSVSTAMLYINYSIPLKTNSSLLQIKHGQLATYNISINSSCLTLDRTILQLRIYSNDHFSPCFKVQCYDGIWQDLTPQQNCANIASSSSSTTIDRAYDGNWGTEVFDFLDPHKSCSNDACYNATLYEEAVIWNITNILSTNLSLDVGANGIQEWNFTRNFNQTNNRTENLNSAINAYLATCTADSEGYCNVPILLHSDTNGTLLINDIFANYTNVTQTADFSSVLNDALNNSLCNCQGCFWSFTTPNCMIPIKIGGINGTLEYHDINITYTTKPMITLNAPYDNYYSGNSTYFSCNATDESPILNISLYIWNSTDIFNITTNLSDKISTTVFTNRTGNYTWNCLAWNDQNYSNSNATNNSLYVDVDSLIVYPRLVKDSITQDIWYEPRLSTNPPSPFSGDMSADYPLETYAALEYSAGNLVSFTCNAIGPNIDDVLLYGNFTGTYNLNTTYQGSRSTDLNVVLNEGVYSWTCAANKSTDGSMYFSHFGNVTLYYDGTAPSISFDSLTTTAGSQTFTFNATVSDISPTRCFYTIYNSGGFVDGASSNVSFTCGQNKNATTTGYGTFSIIVTAYDILNHSSSRSTGVTTSAAPSGGPSTGGGGTTIIVIGGNVSWDMLTEQNTRSYKLIMSSGTSRSKLLAFENKGEKGQNLTLSCQGELCKYITFQKTSVGLPVGKEIITYVTFTISLPKDLNTSQSSFRGNILAEDTSGNVKTVTVEVSISIAGIIPETVEKLTSSLEIPLSSGGTFKIPYFLIFLIVLIGSWSGLYYGLFKGVLKDKIAFSGLISFGIAFVISLLVVYLV